MLLNHIGLVTEGIVVGDIVMDFSQFSDYKMESIHTFCEIWANEEGIILSDKLDKLILNLIDQYICSNYKHSKVRNLLKEVLLLRITTLNDDDKPPLTLPCKTLVANVINAVFVNTETQAKDDIKIGEKGLLDILGLSFNYLFSAREVEFCFNAVDQLLSGYSEPYHKHSQLQDLVMVVECFLNSLISVNPILDCVILADKLYYEKQTFLNIIVFIIFESNNVDLSSQVLFAVIPKILNVSPESNILKILWSQMCSDVSNGLLKIMLSHKLYVLCGLSNYFIPDQMGDFFIFKSNLFWAFIQQGLLSNDTLSRKRGLYLLKRSVDSVVKLHLHVNQELFTSSMTNTSYNIWDNMFTLLDALDEKQSHLVTPVLQQTVKQIEEMKLIHPSWILVVYSRILGHESLQVLRFGISYFLNINVNIYSISPLKSDLIDLLFIKLNNMLLFSHQTGNIIPSHINLKRWFESILLNVTNYNAFLNIIVNAIVKVRWSPCPLFHVLYNMSLIPRGNIFDSSTLVTISEFLKEVIQTQNVYIRGAIQCALLNIITNHTNQKINLSTVVSILSVLKQKECLHRGVITWDIAKQWITSCLFIEQDQQPIAELLMAESNITIGSKARILVLLVDSGVIKIDFTLEKIFRDYFRAIINARSRLYASIEESDKCIEMIINILNDCKLFPYDDDLKNDLLVRSVLPYAKETFPYLRKMLNFVVQIDQFSSIELYIKALNCLSDNSLVYINTVEDILELYSDAQNVLCSSNEYPLIQRYYALKIVLWFVQCVVEENKGYCFGLDKHFKSFCLQFITKGYHEMSKDYDNEDIKRNHKILWGRLNSGYISTMWWILQQCIKKDLINLDEILSLVSVENLIYTAISSIETGGRDSLLPILGIVNNLLPRAVKKPELYKKFLEFSWKSCFELRKISLFWPVFKSWIEISFNSHTIMEKDICLTLLKFSKEILSQGEVVSGLVNVLLSHLKQELKTPNLVMPFLETLTLALIFGPVLRKDQRIENETEDLIRSLDASYAVNILIPKKYDRSSEEVRVTALTIVLSMARLKGGEAVVIGIVQHLVAKYEELTSRRQRYHGNSLHHRIKNRVLQVILILETVLAQSSSVNAQACVTELINWSSSALQGESQQPSVRYQLEWLMTRTLLHCPHRLDTFWTIFNQASEERTGSVCSFISVAYHLATTLRSKEFMDRCVTEILPWCMAQHFNLRLYAQVVLQKLWPLDCHVASKYEVIRNSLSKSLNQGNSIRNAEKLEKDFYFTDFHILNHFSLETIFWELPRLSNICKDEWIPVSTLEHYFVDQDPCVPLTNQDDKLKLFTAATWVIKATADSEVNVDASCLQKKFVPWKNMFPELEETKINSRTELIVVASLIDKLPNLGGLARSCEVFTAKSLVVPSLEYTQDKVFSTLSMSAEKHIEIVEVKPHNLPEYLIERKNAGYSLVGAEQTAASVSLETFKFPKKCLLLLGNEKEGIPVNLLPLLDVCVEVRQLGVVRSLNVHVTGALFLWEYTRQYLDCNTSGIK